jgi:NagD protein
LFFIDVQGTLISDADKTPIPGAIEFIDTLNQKSIPYMVVTNNTKNPSNEFYEYLKSIGFNFDFDRYIDPLMTLECRVEKQNIAAYGEKEFISTVEAMGYTLDYENPKCVLVALKKDFISDEYAQMIDFLLNGASLIGMHGTSIYAKNGKRYPGVGAILKMLEFATSVGYDVIGKPSVAFYEEALKKLRQQNSDADFSNITMISDDVTGDLGGAKELGMRCIFVTSGKYKNADEIIPSLEEHLKPDAIYKNMKDILEKGNIF